MERETKICNECGISYFIDSSKMESMCPECANIIYGYEPCEHLFETIRCTKCNWDGSASEYIKSLIEGNK